jgi:SAM-dependent methyltransferase
VLSPREEARESVVRASYDRVPYGGGAHPQTFPPHLAALAILAGLEPPDPETAHVLELGCADGGNLLAMAESLPRGRFTGIDLAPRHIEIARGLAGELHLPNVDLRVLSILDVTPSLGTFDYVVCHGVFSWVEPSVQEQIFAVCRQNLAPGGIAYVSYNCLPGWHMRLGLRDALRYYGADLAPRAQLARASEVAALFAEAAGERGDAYAQVLRSAGEILADSGTTPEYLVHEYFEDTNAPIYFHDLMRRARRHGLEYAGDAEPSDASLEHLPPSLRERLRALGGDDPVVREQSLDFLVNRMFRRSLFTHAGAAIDEQHGSAARMRRLWAYSQAKPLSAEPDLRNGARETFVTPRGDEFHSDDALAKAALVALARAWPRSVPFDALVPGAGADALAPIVATLHRLGLLSLRAMPVDCAATAGETPAATPLARRQAAAGPLVANRYGRTIDLQDPMLRFILLQLDGARDRPALLRLIDDEVSAGRLRLFVDGRPLALDEPRTATLEQLLDYHLGLLVTNALLVSPQAERASS